MFTTPEELFKLTVMFFRLTNSLATFQAMMNEILWDFINTGRMTSFINDVIIGTESEERHNKLVEVVKRLAENNLYMKLEKCKWKVREVGFLEVVIEPERIKMEKEKVMSNLDLPTPKGVKDVQKFLGLVNYYC